MIRHSYGDTMPSIPLKPCLRVSTKHEHMCGGSHFCHEVLTSFLVLDGSMRYRNWAAGPYLSTSSMFFASTESCDISAFSSSRSSLSVSLASSPVGLSVEACPAVTPVALSGEVSPSEAEL